MRMKLAFVSFVLALPLVACDAPGGQPSAPLPDVGQGDSDAEDGGPKDGCADGEKGGDETDVDCGGSCGPCADGKACLAGDDCASGTCGVAYVCLPATCANGTQDPGETGVDCGGSCPTCFGGSCSDDAQCVSGYCKAGVCSEPTCNDGVKNGAETGVDCAGECPLCADGNGCLHDGNCISGFCKAGLCASPTCSDGVRNGTETDVDCGGGCPGCGLGDTCQSGGDCESGKCDGGVCAEVPPACDDGVKNGDETDVDCGGGCDGCGLGKACEVDGDCLSALCEAGTCALPASCQDGEKNQGETDVDCGGGACSPCALGKGCIKQSDCLSDACVFGVCQAPTCDDGQRNQGETDVDCGGPKCGGCAAGQACEDGDDCASGVCEDEVCVSCEDGQQNGDETGVDCGGACGATCPDGGACLGAGDCVSGRCDDGVCASCQDGVKSGPETDVDCGGGACDPCPAGDACESASDCQTTGCVGGQCCDVNACGGCAATPVETCNGVDDDCDGETDEAPEIGTPAACDKQQGVCAGAVAACKGAKGWVCEAAEYLAVSPHYEATEVSCDGLDNDCDGQTDELPECLGCNRPPKIMFEPVSGKSPIWSRDYFAMHGTMPVGVVNEGTGGKLKLLKGWTDEVTLATDPVGIATIAAGDGEVYVAYKYGSSPVMAQLVAVSGETPTSLDATSSTNSYWDVISTAARGTAVAWAYVDQATGKTMVAHRKTAAEEWTMAELAPSALEGEDVSLFFTPDLGLYTARPVGNDIRVTHPDGTTTDIWAEVGASNVRLAVSAGGDLGVAYTKDGKLTLRLDEAASSGGLVDTIEGASAPYLTTTQDGVILAAWLETDDLVFAEMTADGLAPLGAIPWNGPTWPSAVNVVVDTHNRLHLGVLQTTMAGSLAYGVYCPGAPMQGPCEPECTLKLCGSDGCGGSCGSCEAGQVCNDQFYCEAAAGQCGADAGATCAGHCGSSSPAPGGCYCDATCVGNGDCCEDYDACCGG